MQRVGPTWSLVNRRRILKIVFLHVLNSWFSRCRSRHRESGTRWKVGILMNGFRCVDIPASRHVTNGEKNHRNDLHQKWDSDWILDSHNIYIWRILQIIVKITTSFCVEWRWCVCVCVFQKKWWNCQVGRLLIWQLSYRCRPYAPYNDETAPLDLFCNLDMLHKL